MARGVETFTSLLHWLPEIRIVGSNPTLGAVFQQWCNWKVDDKIGTNTIKI
jgi:hypothetical protein